MNSVKPLHALATAVATAALAASPLLMPAQAQAAGGLKCRASVSDATPSQYSNVYVKVNTGRAKASVRTVAHYSTTNTAKNRRSNSNGRASITYYISGARPGYRVKVDVTVKKSGHTKTCSTSFTPHR